MATAWIYIANVITTNEAIGNALAGAIGFDAEDNLTFTRGRRLRRISDGATAWFAQVPLKQTGYDRIAEFNGAGPYTMLHALGLTDPQIAAGKAALRLEFGPRAIFKGRWQAFINEQGYEVVQ